MGAVRSRKVVTMDARLTGWGWCSQGTDCEGQLEHEPSKFSHQFPGNFSGVSHPEMFPSIHKGQPHPKKKGHYQDGGQHQSSGGVYSPVDCTCWYAD